MKSREGDIVGNLWIEVGKRDLYNSGTIDSEDHNTSDSSIEMKRHVSSPSIHNQKHETNTVFCEYNTDSMYNVCHTQSKNEEPSKNILQWKAQSTEELDFLWILLPSNLDILCICIPCRRYPQGDERANQLVIKELIVCLRSIAENRQSAIYREIMQELFLFVWIRWRDINIMFTMILIHLSKRMWNILNWLVLIKIIMIVNVWSRNQWNKFKFWSILNINSSRMISREGLGSKHECQKSKHQIDEDRMECDMKCT